MNVFTFVFLVVTVALCAGVIRTWLEQRNNRSESAEEIEQALARIEALEERVQVLERIVTENRFDSGVDLKRKIDSL